MTTNLILKIKFFIYKNICIIFLIITSIIIYIISNLFFNFFPIHIIYNIIDFIESLPIRETIQKTTYNLTYNFTYPFFICYFFIKPTIINIYDFSILSIKYCSCTFHYLYFMVKQYIYLFLPTDKPQFGIIWGEEITNIKFSTPFINKFLYFFCDSITYIIVFTLKLIKALVYGITRTILIIIYIILLILILLGGVLIALVKGWLSYEVNPSLFTFLFIILPFSYFVYYEHWYNYQIDVLHNSQVYVYWYNDLNIAWDDYVMDEYLNTILKPFIIYKLIFIVLYILQIISKFGCKGILFFTWLCWFFSNISLVFILIFLFNIIAFVCYLSVYNLAFKHFIKIPYSQLKKKKWVI